MKIQRIIYQHRRDFSAIYECGHCGDTFSNGGYDDANFHENVIPSMECRKCGKKGEKEYTPRETKYPEGLSI